MESQLETNRLSLHPFNTNDLDSLHRLWTHPDVRRYLWDGIEITRERAAEEIAKSIESFNNRGFGFWALLLKEDKTLVGFCGLRLFAEGSDVEILYGIEPGAMGKGYGHRGGAGYSQLWIRGLPIATNLRWSRCP